MSTKRPDTKSEAKAVLQYNNRAFRKGIKPSDAVEHYSKWASDNQYDEDMCPERYEGPRLAAECLAGWFTEGRDSVKILDVAAGTGLVAEHLIKYGFNNMDAVEPSLHMLKAAGKKRLYRNTYNEYLGTEPLPLTKDSYDACVVCGGMGEGHIPCGGIKELIRLTRSGGVICIVMREMYIYEAEEYKDRLEPLMNKLEKDGKWKKISRKVVPNYFMHYTGLAYMYMAV